MPSIIITGLPGTGKTPLALQLGSTLLNHGIPALVLHTDILKITLRKIEPQSFKGPGYGSDHPHKLQQIQPYLTQQVNKADREGYVVIVEGTLACNFCPPDSLYILLELEESIREQRIRAKHPSAQRSLQQISPQELDRYRQALEVPSIPYPLRLDTRQSLDTLVAQILADPRCPVPHTLGSPP